MFAERSHRRGVNGVAMLWNQIERRGLTRSHDSEVAPVERRDRCDSEAFAEDDKRRIDGAQRQIAVPPDELGDRLPISWRYRFKRERAGSQVAQEPDLYLRPETGGEKVCDLPHRQQGYVERA